MIQRHFTAEEYAELEQQAGKAITIRQAMFTAPWYMATVDAETLPARGPKRRRAQGHLQADPRSYARLVERAPSGAGHDPHQPA
jgi:hypothetical protein